MDQQVTVKFGKGIGNHIKQVRKSKGMGRDKLAETTHLDVVYINLIERDKKPISLVTLIKLATALDMPLLECDTYRL